MTTFDNIFQYFKLIPQFISWSRSPGTEDSHGMRLASVYSRAENDQLLKELRDSGQQGIASSVWMGATALGNEPYFYWMGRNRAMTFTDWVKGDPNNFDGYEDCMELRFESDLKWNDCPCDEKKNFVCEEQISKAHQATGPKCCVSNTRIFLGQLPGTQSLHELLGTRSSRK